MAYKRMELSNFQMGIVCNKRNILLIEVSYSAWGYFVRLCLLYRIRGIIKKICIVHYNPFYANLNNTIKTVSFYLKKVIVPKVVHPV